MGLNTTVLILNDAAHDIENDPDFGKKIVAAMSRMNSHEQIVVRAGSHGNAATVIETHHADSRFAILVGENMATIINGRMLAKAWKRYREVFGREPRGTEKQLGAMLCFLRHELKEPKDA